MCQLPRRIGNSGLEDLECEYVGCNRKIADGGETGKKNLGIGLSGGFWGRFSMELTGKQNNLQKRLGNFWIDGLWRLFLVRLFWST